MKSIKFNKKLSLNKETISHLTGKEMRNVGGVLKEPTTKCYTMLYPNSCPIGECYTYIHHCE